MLILEKEKNILSSFYKGSSRGKGNSYLIRRNHKRPSYTFNNSFVVLFNKMNNSIDCYERMLHFDDVEM